jgi:hypothetical protein
MILPRRLPDFASRGDPALAAPGLPFGMIIPITHVE